MTFFMIDIDSDVFDKIFFCILDKIIYRKG